MNVSWKKLVKNDFLWPRKQTVCRKTSYRVTQVIQDQEEAHDGLMTSVVGQAFQLIKPQGSQTIIRSGETWLLPTFMEDCTDNDNFVLYRMALFAV